MNTPPTTPFWVYLILFVAGVMCFVLAEYVFPKIIYDKAKDKKRDLIILQVAFSLSGLIAFTMAILKYLDKF